MLVPNRLKSLYEGPLPPMGLTDYESLSKFLNAGAQRCRTSGRNFDLFLDWVIHALLASLTSDSAARVFLPKTRTALSGIRPNGKKRIQLSETHLIAPVWNNTDLGLALEAFYDSGFEDVKIEQQFGGAYIEELRLAIIDSPADVDIPNVLRVWNRGSLQLDTYSLKALEPVLSTNGDAWYLQEGDDERAEPVREPRMAALYNCGLRRYCGK